MKQNNKILIVFEMANNHMGDLEHAKKMIHEYSCVANEFSCFDFAWKFQLRNLESFIHNSYKHSNHKYVERFLQTKLQNSELLELKNIASSMGFRTTCTAFDEESVDDVFDMNFDIVKVASCSFLDWPLLNKIVYRNKKSPRPIIMSTAGSTIKEIDKVVNFMLIHNANISLMHCVAEYPTNHNNLQLNQIDFLVSRYPLLKIGHSTHDKSNEIDSIFVAISKNASIIERHVALQNEKYKINEYSITPDTARSWLRAGEKCLEICGQDSQRNNFTKKETEDLFQFKRGVFAKKNILKNTIIDSSNSYCAWPATPGQLLASDLGDEITSVKDIEKDDCVLLEDLNIISKNLVFGIVDNIKNFIVGKNIFLPNKFGVEISHHYGIDRFYEFGISIINIINEEYCKKLLILFPGQTHPEQYHKNKIETFFIIFGELILSLDGIEKKLSKGEMITINREVRHKLFTKTGCVIEELSNRHDPEDSFYVDNNINKDRKTIINCLL